MGLIKKCLSLKNLQKRFGLNFFRSAVTMVRQMAAPFILRVAASVRKFHCLYSKSLTSETTVEGIRDWPEN